MILGGLIQAIIVILVCCITIIASNQLQKWESGADGFVDELALLLLFGVAALISGTVVLAPSAYLMLKQRTNEGFMLLLSTIVWLVLLLGCILIGIVFLDIHTII